MFPYFSIFFHIFPYFSIFFHIFPYCSMSWAISNPLTATLAPAPSRTPQTTGPVPSRWRRRPASPRWRNLRIPGGGWYPLVICYIAMENGHLVREFSHKKWWISIVMLVYRRVFHVVMWVMWWYFPSSESLSWWVYNSNFTNWFMAGK